MRKEPRLNYFAGKILNVLESVNKLKIETIRLQQTEKGNKISRMREEKTGVKTMMVSNSSSQFLDSFKRDVFE